MNVEAVCRPLMEFERAMADLYARWAGVFDDDREAAFVWVKMANEEKGHASLIDYQRRVFQKNPKLAGEVDVDLGAIASGMAHVRSLYDASVPPTLAEAVALAYGIETSAAESHFRNAIRQANPELERLLGCLGGEDKAHLERLKEFAARRGIALPPPAPR
jgi:hypothetical protein